MNIEIIGVNHRTAPIALREKLSFPNNRLIDALTGLKQAATIREGVILSTCNRVEIYVRGNGANNLNRSVEDFLEAYHRVPGNEFRGHLYAFSGPAAVKHLFRVSSSLDSQVLGESQILGQVKEAYYKARQAGTVERVFTCLFEAALKIGKRARSQTQIGYGAVSISTAAVEMAKKIFADLSGRKILIIGAGKIGELSAKHLHGRGAAKVLVANRTFSKAQKLAEILDGTAVPFEKFPEALREADIVISSVSSPQVLVTLDMAGQLILERRQRPIFFIDLGLPRNIDPLAHNVDNVYVYNLDDLQKVNDDNRRERMKEAEKIERMIEAQVVKTEIRLKELLHNAR